MTITAFKRDSQGDWIEKYAAAVKDYTVNAADWLVTDTIATITVAVATGITLGATSHDDTTATMWLSGGTAGTTYLVTLTFTTTAGRTEVVKFRVVVK